MRIDQLGRKILSELARNSRNSYTRIAKAGVIQGFVPVINYDALSYHVYAILLTITNLTDKREATLKEFLLTNPDILWAVKTIGRYNVIMKNMRTLIFVRTY